MNGIEDLVRETLAERAHDVDGVVLATTPAPRHTPQRWVAVGTAVTVAAAILVAVVLVAPWRGEPGPTPVATDKAANPPAGMRSVNFHGITLTVPDAWEVGQFFCTVPTSSAVVVQGYLVPSCPAGPGRQNTTPDTATVVTLIALNGANPRGQEVTVGGHRAYRLDTSQTVDPPSPLTVHVELPDAGVQLTVEVPSGDESAVQHVLDGIAYTAVDTNGCTAQLSADAVPETLPAGPVAVGAATGGVLCEYATSNGGGDLVQNGYLFGSRVLTAQDISALDAAAQRATPWDDAARGNGFLVAGTTVFHLTGDDGTTRTISARGDGMTIAITDGTHRAALPGSDLNLPGAYNR